MTAAASRAESDVRAEAATQADSPFVSPLAVWVFYMFKGRASGFVGCDGECKAGATHLSSSVGLLLLHSALTFPFKKNN